MTGHLALVLHGHLPFVRHPEHESFLEENWLFEAIIESYVPLIRALDQLVDQRVPTRLTLSLSPTLVAMLRDRFLQDRFLAHLDKMRHLAEREVDRTRGDSRFAPLARLYQARLEETHAVFVDRCHRELLAAFADLARAGVLELMTCAATHGYLPLLQPTPAAVRAQIQVGARMFRDTFGHDARGIWLPECGYYPGLEAPVADAGFAWFILDTHGLAHADPPADFHAAVACPNGVAAFGRDPACSRQVWSREEGYPGDPWYRDFYRDIGFDLPFADIQPYILDQETRIMTGFKYHRITGAEGDKAPYDRAMALERAAVHARHFVAERLKTLDALPESSTPIMVAPFDAELFGHWWFEGPDWLAAVVRETAYHAGTLELATPSDHLATAPAPPVATPAASSWGDQGHNAHWLNPGNDWIWPPLHAATRTMSALVDRHGDAPADSPTGRALRQAARTLLLAQASDWPFILKTGTSPAYAEQRLRDHLARFHWLAQALDTDNIDPTRLRALEIMDQIFPDIDPAVFA